MQSGILRVPVVTRNSFSDHLLVQIDTQREQLFRRNLPPTSSGSEEKTSATVTVRGKDLDYKAYASATGGYSGSDIKLVCKEAAMRPLRRIMRILQDIEDADGSARDENEVLKGGCIILSFFFLFGPRVVVQVKSRKTKRRPCVVARLHEHAVDMDPVCHVDVEASLDCVNASGGTFKKRYEKWNEQFGSGSKA